MGTTQVEMLKGLEHVEESVNVRRAFGDPLGVDGVTVIPTAKVGGAVGGGGGDAPGGAGGGSGSGFALNTKPLGVFVIREGKVRWMPAVDVNRMILGGQLVAIAALLFARALVKARAEERG